MSMECKKNVTVYVPVELINKAKDWNINISQAATSGISRAIKKAELMAEYEKKVEEELSKMEI